MQKITLPQDKSLLIINQNLMFNFQSRMPNIWVRFWQYILLGWKWEDLTKNNQKQ